MEIRDSRVITSKLVKGIDKGDKWDRQKNSSRKLPFLVFLSFSYKLKTKNQNGYTVTRWVEVAAKGVVV